MRNLTRREFAGALAATGAGAAKPDPVIKVGVVRLNDDGGWCWFQDERAIVHDGKLIVGSVASGTKNPERKGNIEVAFYDLEGGRSRVTVLHHSESDRARKRWHDDHNAPALLARPDGRVVALYAQHGVEDTIYCRISGDEGWGDEKTFVPSASSRVTYANLHLLRRENGGKGRIYNFYRGLDNSYKPSYAYSDDFGETWTSGNVFIDVPGQFRHRPYVKYVSNGEDTVHVFYTDGHPRDFDNSVYHIVYRGGQLLRSDGSAIGSLRDGLRTPEAGTRVFAGEARNVGWVSDIQLDRAGRPYGVFSVRRDRSGDDHRYHYARWTGKQWEQHEIAYAGSKLYAGEDDYTGNICVDPHNPDVVFFATDSDPKSGRPVFSATDQQRHWELFESRTQDGGRTWTHTALTRDSTQDQIRPIVPVWPGPKRALLWLRGKMRTYTDYSFEVVARIDGR